MVDDDPAAADRQQAPNNFMPAVAVNKDGVVGAMWYDRRQDPSNLGWSIRFAASIDGGETWLPSVPVSPRPNVFDPDGFLSTTMFGGGVTVDLNDGQMYAGDYAGMAAAADGSFHPFWIDNRTGIPQVWSARIRVDGTAIRNGSRELENLVDVSSRVRVEGVRAEYRGGLVTTEVTLTNTSSDPIRLPAALRVVAAHSAIGRPQILNADNGETGTGAVWNLAPYIGGGELHPGATSRPLTIRCRLNPRKSLLEGDIFHYRVVRLETTVLATDTPKP
jgi:hypothetical protein